MGAWHNRTSILRDYVPDEPIEGHHNPRDADKCCICTHSVSLPSVVYEDRPSGLDVKMERWSYCKGCWWYMQRMRSYAFSQKAVNRLLHYLRETDI